MLVSILSNIMIFNMPQCAGFDKVCARKAVWSRSRWLDKWWKHSVPWPSSQYGLSLSLLGCMHTHSEHFKGFTWKKMHLHYFTFDIKTSYFNVILSVWFPLEESLWITDLVFFFNVYIIHMLGFCEKIIVVGDVVEESLILELCGYSSMFTLLKIKSSYEYLEDMIKESR